MKESKAYHTQTAAAVVLDSLTTSENMGEATPGNTRDNEVDKALVSSG
jgi:hypothetical protein